jgi:hypothetical protein
MAAAPCAGFGKAIGGKFGVFALATRERPQTLTATQDFKPITANLIFVIGFLTTGHPIVKTPEGS